MALAAAPRRPRRLAAGGRRSPQVLDGEVLERVGAPAGVQEVGGDEGVEARARERDAGPGEDDEVALRVGARPCGPRVLEERPQQPERLVAGRRLRHSSAAWPSGT